MDFSSKLRSSGPIRKHWYNYSIQESGLTKKRQKNAKREVVTKKGRIKFDLKK